MADDVTPGTTPQEPARRRATDLPLLMGGVLTVTASVYLFVGGTWDAQWLLALVAVGVGIAMLLASVRPRSS